MKHLTTAENKHDFVKKYGEKVTTSKPGIKDVAENEVLVCIFCANAARVITNDKMAAEYRKSTDIKENREFYTLDKKYIEKVPVS